MFQIALKIIVKLLHHAYGHRTIQQDWIKPCSQT